jgi:hypothetical protein
VCPVSIFRDEEEEEEVAENDIISDIDAVMIDAIIRFSLDLETKDSSSTSTSTSTSTSSSTSISTSELWSFQTVSRKK